MTTLVAVYDSEVEYINLVCGSVAAASVIAEKAAGITLYWRIEALSLGTRYKAINGSTVYYINDEEQ